MQVLSQFFGRFHPLIVHLPIGILFLAFIFEWLSYFPKYKKLKQAVQPSLFWGALSAIAAAVSGYFLSQEGGYEERLLNLHRNTGIATAVFATLIFFIRKSVITFFDDKKKRKQVRIFLFIPLIGVLSLAGHLGGSLTHGEDYLLSFASTETSGAAAEIKIKSMEDVDSAVLYTDVIAPILSAKCYSCHSASKQKGQLRLDDIKFIEKGGKHGEVLDKVIPDSSALYSRMLLPIEDEAHMPPHEKPQLSSAEIALVQAWVEEGSSFDRRIKGYKQVARIKGYISSFLTGSKSEPLIPDKEVAEASKKAVSDLTTSGVLIIPVAASTHYLSASFVNKRSATDKELEMLLTVKDQLLWLNLGRTKATDEGLLTVSKLTNLTQLNLEYTQVTDQGMERLKSLSELTSINLVGTKVGDQGLDKLGSLKKLKQIFLYQTSVSVLGTTALLKSLPEIHIDTGSYELPFLATDTTVFKSPQ